MGDSSVTILSNTRGINNATPTVLPVKNTNGVGISTVGFNTVTKDVTVGLCLLGLVHHSHLKLEIR